MADISQVTLPNNSTFDLKDAVSRQHLVYYIEGADTDTTAGTWTGTCVDIESYYNGLTVIFKPKVAGAATTTLNINGFGAKTCYYTNATKLTTHFSVGIPIMLTYVDGTWRRADYDSNSTTIANLYHGNGTFVADSAVYRYQLLAHVDDNRLTPFNNNNNVTGTTKIMLTGVSFNAFDDILYWSTTSNVAANVAISAGSCLFACSGIDLRYSFNITTTAFTAQQFVYLKVIPQGGWMVKLASADPLTQTLPTSDDGLWYIRLGRAYNGYCISLYADKPVFAHNGTALYRVSPYPAESASLIEGDRFRIIHS